ncbi:hypothetical protein ACWDUL_25450 [Nocardia niigatensis]|uniref:hypothetical protein n=1 Tax=Nocardia niigatensis TaxID=209249 RepID=UPI0002F64F23|nr:hypothetical protein [Nocardia niigatensis]
MNGQSLCRLAAVAGVVCGVATALAGVLETVAGQKFPVTEVLNGGAVPFGIALAAGLYLAQYQRMGRFGGWAFAVHFLSFGYFAGIAYTMNFVLVHLDPAVVDRLLAGPARVVPPAAVGCYVLGLTVLSLTFLLPAPVVRVGHVFVGAGMIWLAGWLWASAGRSADRLPQYS